MYFISPFIRYKKNQGYEGYSTNHNTPVDNGRFTAAYSCEFRGLHTHWLLKSHVKVQPHWTRYER